MAIVRKVSERVRRYFNPDKFDPSGFLEMMMSGLVGLLISEVVVFILLRQSSELGELPNYITDALIIGISLLEFFVVPLISWLGYGRRRSVLMCWAAVVLFCTLPMFALPGPETPVDAGLCTTVAPPAFATGISTITAIRLSMLLILGLVSALARAAYISHGLTYLDEHNPSENLHMHVAIFVICRVMVYLMGSAFEHTALNLLWLQLFLIVFTSLSTLIKLFKYPEAAPAVVIQSGSDRGLLSSAGRVLSSGVVVLQILGMSLLAAACWGFGMHEAAFVQVKYYIVPDEIQFAKVIKLMSVILGVVLAGYVYTTPVMAKFDRKAAVSNVFKLCGLVALLYFLLTYVLGCNRSGIGGLEDLKYNQPACGLNCSCDRPWMVFTPVCVPEQMTTYFSPCHAGCASADTVNNVGVFSNCTCAPGGRVTIGACNDGSCAQQYFLHQMFYVVAALSNTLVFAWQATVILESVDKRDVAVAIGLTSACVSLFAFVGAHGFYMWISSFTCAFASGSKCLLQNEQFPNWVGYTSVVLALCALLFSLITFIVLRRQKETNFDESRL